VPCLTGRRYDVRIFAIPWVSIEHGTAVVGAIIVAADDVDRSAANVTTAASCEKGDGAQQAGAHY
jgi:hypothetical protein